MNLHIDVTTQSNLYIGGMPQTFEIGGVDMQTTIDHKKQPVIPASSFKGALREIVNNTPDNSITNLYKTYLAQTQKLFETTINSRREYRDEEKEKFIKDYKKVIKDASVLSLFGIPGFNHAPKLLFHDLTLTTPADSDLWFSLDMKNSICEKDEHLQSNPRSYKTARAGLIFSGSITFYQGHKLGTQADNLVEAYLVQCLKQFNDGLYRIGNSKSRGYGFINVTFPAKAVNK